MNYYVYMHSRPDGSIFYVGKGKGKRKYDMKSSRNEHYKNIISKYGHENIHIHSIDCDTETNAFELERILIKTCRIAGMKIVNQTDGGDGCSGYVHSIETREKISKKGIGRVITQITRDKLSLAMKGRVFSSETLVRMKQADRSYLKGKPSGMLGKKHSAAVCELISKANSGVPKKKVACSTCGKEVSVNTLHRWHEENCKYYMDKK